MAEMDSTIEAKFLGDNTVVETDELRYLVNGEMIHGAQYRDAVRRDLAVPYYLSPGPVPEIFEALDETPREGETGVHPVAVVGLGVGGLAAFARSGQPLTFYEIDPEVVALARGQFEFLENSPGKVGVVIGDGRLGLRASPPGYFGMILVDAFRGDAVPTHLITLEAIRMYLDRLDPGGMLVFHVSNKYVDLRPVLVKTAERLGLQARIRCHDPGGDSRYTDRFAKPTRWVALGSSDGALGRLAAHPDWHGGTTEPTSPIWTDEKAASIYVVR